MYKNEGSNQPKTVLFFLIINPNYLIDHYSRGLNYLARKEEPMDIKMGPVLSKKRVTMVEMITQQQ